MTKDEFNRWLKSHEACFPGVRAWLQQMPKPDSQQLLSMWWRVLKTFSLATCEQASEDLWQAGGGNYGDHPILLKREIAARRPAAEEPADTGPSLWQATPAHRAEAQAVIADARAALVRPVGRRVDDVDFEIDAVPGADDRPRSTPNCPQTVAEMREYAKQTAMPCRIETVGQYCDRMSRQKRKRR